MTRYERFIEWCRTSPKEGGIEKHHILPKSMGGTDEEENIIALTYREHFIAHWMLWKIHRNQEMADAFWLMAHTKQYRRMNSRTFQKLKEQRNLVLSRRMSENNPSTWPSVKEKRRVAALGNDWGRANKGFKKTEQQIENHKKSLLEYYKNNTTSDKQKSSVAEANRKRANKPKVSCPFCQKIGAEHLMNRYHFDKCREKK